MQYVIVVLIVAVAVALVMVPLLRGQRGAAAGDMDAPPPAPRTAPQPRAPASPQTPPSPGETDAEEMPIVAPPLPFRMRPGTGLSATEEEVLRYREALRARTVCQFCSAANPPGSKYCKECGKEI